MTMRRQRLTLSAVTRRERHGAMADINAAISAAGGWVVSHALYSNIALAVSFTLPADNLGLLRDALLQAGLSLDAAGLAGLAAPPGDDGETTVALNVTFVHDDPDLRHDVPAVPG